MNPFSVMRPADAGAAVEILASGDHRLPILKAGGMDVVDHLKEGLIDPDVLVDVRSIEPPDGVDRVRASADGVEFAATTTLAMLDGSASVRRHAPVIAEACGSAATPQVRAVASAAGNLLQRPRCWYYRRAQFDCLKKGGDRCYAIDGENDYHAIFGGASCHIVHPSNLAIALSVTEGVVHVIGGDRETIAIGDLFTSPSQGVRREHDLGADELITHVRCAPAPNSAFHAIKHKQSFDWPLVAAAAALELDGDRITSARICAGAVAPIPWRLPAVERALVGVNVNDSAAIRTACERAAEGARPMSENAYKVTLLPVAVRRAVRRAAGMPELEDAR